MTARTSLDSFTGILDLENVSIGTIRMLVGWCSTCASHGFGIARCNGPEDWMRLWVSGVWIATGGAMDMWEMWRKRCT